MNSRSQSGCKSTTSFLLCKAFGEIIFNFISFNPYSQFLKELAPFRVGKDITGFCFWQIFFRSFSTLFLQCLFSISVRTFAFDAGAKVVQESAFANVFDINF